MNGSRAEHIHKYWPYWDVLKEAEAFTNVIMVKSFCSESYCIINLQWILKKASVMPTDYSSQIYIAHAIFSGPVAPQVHHELFDSLI